MATGTVGVGVRDLSSGNPDAELLPDLRASLARLHLDHRSYDDEPVIPELIELARADLAESGVEAGGIALASGAFDAVERVLNAHLGPGDVVAVEDPCYSPTIDLIRAMVEGRPISRRRFPFSNPTNQSTDPTNRSTD